ncbi:response regulator [Cypionkella sp.]|uniref:response regulator n=1 Tax=Cypionkella sp. TaxID=2811411 RepID=UPI002618CAB2|nr:response regulator [Cypionkella sp.]MDB5666451.1 response regulator receiver protein [Cypionkella sp.]
MSTNSSVGLADTVGLHLPMLRRYARALTGNQTSGDRYALAALETVLAEPALIAEATDAKVALFNVFHMVWASSGAPVGQADNRLSAAAQAHMADLTPNSREALLLHFVEGFTAEQIGAIMQTDAEEALGLINMALREMTGTVSGRIMVIEDEAIIAMDIIAIVEAMGHQVTGVARTRKEAVALAKSDMPDLILADIHLADSSSGIDAVNDILAGFDHIPVIFITAFPERLLTGERPEPAFLINKPYSEEQVRSSVSQAMFFASTETLMESESN